MTTTLTTTSCIEEHEAKKHFCPLSHMFGENWSGFEKCEGRRCMAWRWVDSTHGYCGMAGYPTNTVVVDADELTA
ncbi:hypothetical protein [Oceanidesulfovibrio marinus]|uniref:hypothetical protein n=1 Tax=Oceanidesulfovibrio marinus TaxID=370038 RepID=UPI00118678FA|nr:hypothetical protein [Oceanidesulfovibrio marinus]